MDDKSESKNYGWVALLVIIGIILLLYYFLYKMPDADPQKQRNLFEPYSVSINGGQVKGGILYNYIEVDLTFKNNSGKDSSFDSVYYMKAYQNGIELPNSYLNTVDTDTNIQSGMSIKVKDEFILRNTDDDIEIRVYKVKNNKEVSRGFLS